MKVLLCGFEPFGKLNTNPSWEAVKLVREDLEKDIEVKKLLLPVEYKRAPEMLLSEMEAHHYDVILCTGVAVSRRAVTPEYVAVNVKDSLQPDNAGKVCIYERIEEEGEAVLYTNLPLTEMLDAIHAAGVPCAPSFDAGAYVCNTLFYSLMHGIKYGKKNTYGGFLHLPPENEVKREDAARAIEAILLLMADKEPAKVIEE
ncbi:MAG: pyroglutamyl-peptidase I [Clostridia bacterium]|nr:pyroglutamyl-peptidase I [Clostridia bacterium]